MNEKTERSKACGKGSLALVCGVCGIMFVVLDLGLPRQPQGGLFICEEVEPNGCCLRDGPGGCDKWECTKDFPVNKFF